MLQLFIVNIIVLKTNIIIIHFYSELLLEQFEAYLYHIPFHTSHTW